MLKAIRKISITGKGGHNKTALNYKLGIPVWVVEKLGIDEENREVEITVKDGVMLAKPLNKEKK